MQKPFAILLAATLTLSACAAINRESRLDMREIGAEVLFEHYASTFTGDARALCDQSRNRIGNRPVPFPPDADMLAQAADRLKPTIRSELQNNRALHL